MATPEKNLARPSVPGLIAGLIAGLTELIFRTSPTKEVPRVGFELFQALDVEWRLVVESRAAAEASRRWADDRALRDLKSLDDVLARTAPGTDRAEADAVLYALVRRAPNDQLAARAVLQAIKPGLASVARRMGAARDDDVAAEVVAVALEKITRYPWERRRRAVAANLVLDVLGALWRARPEQLDRPREKYVPPEVFAQLPTRDVEQGASGPGAREVLAAVAKSGRVPIGQLAVVADQVLERTSAADAAARAGISIKAMRHRRDRARARVVRAWQTERSA